MNIFFQKSRCAKFERGGAGSADSFGRHKPDRPPATLACRADALALDVHKEGAFLRAIDLPVAKIIFVQDNHFRLPLPTRARSPSALLSETVGREVKATCQTCVRWHGRRRPSRSPAPRCLLLLLFARRLPELRSPRSRSGHSLRGELRAASPVMAVDETFANLSSEPASRPK